MYKKKLQRLGAVCLAAAMVFTTFSFPDAVKAEEASAAVTANEEAGTILMQVKPSVLQANAICNTQQKPQQGKDGLASWAFDEEDHWWHSRWNQTGKETSEDTINATVRPWIGSGFGREIWLKKITYTGRTDKAYNVHNNIIKYSLYYADMEEPTATPTSSDWVLAKTGYFTSAVEAQDIVLEEAVKATHFKLVAENTNNWANNDTAANGYHGAGSNGGGDTSAENIKVYAEDTLNLTVKAPIDGEVLGETENAVSSECVEEAVVEDVTDHPIDTTNAVVNSDGTFSGQITGVDDSKLDVLSGNTPFMIRAKVKLNAVPTTNHVLINRGTEPYQVAYGKDDHTIKIKFQMRDTGGQWHEAKCTIDSSMIGQEIDVLALYTGAKMGVWVDGERNAYEKVNADSGSFTMKSGSAKALKIGESGSPASIESIQIVNNIGTVDSDANYNSTVIPAFNQARELLNIQIVKKTHLVERTHNYTLATKWVDAESQTQLTKADAKTVKKYNAVAIATPADPLVFIEDSAPETINVNVDGTNVIEEVPVTSSSVDEKGILTLSYKFEDLFIGGSLRMDYGKDYTKTSMRFGYDFALPEGADFTGCEWYYGTTATALTHKLAPTSTKYITNPGDKGEGVYRSNIVFTNLGSANYASDVYARVLVKYTLDGKNYSKMGSFIDTRTVEKVAREIQNSDKATQREKDYAENILKELAK